MNNYDFKEMVAYEFSSLSKTNPKELSRVTVLDCKHCNDPFLPSTNFEMLSMKRNQQKVVIN